MAGAKEVQNTADRPNVALFIVAGQLPRFRSAPLLNAGLALHLRIMRETVRDVEIDELRVQLRAHHSQHDVVRLDVAVHYAL